MSQTMASGFFIEGALQSVRGIGGDDDLRAALGEHAIEIGARVRFFVDDEQTTARECGARYRRWIGFGGSR